MKKRYRIILPLLLIMLIVIGCTSVMLVSVIGNYGTLINYVGIVRGASQRTVKLETNQLPSDELIAYVGSILQELETGEGPYGLHKTSCAECNDNILLLSDQWDLVRGDIEAVRAGAESDKLLADSEALFSIANDTVFSFERYSHTQVTRLAILIIAMTLVCLAAGVFITAATIKQYWALKETNASLANKAFRDELTGALILDKFISDAEQILFQHPEEKFAILYIDLENFKYINDVFGYPYGDEILKKYAALMMADTQENERFARNIADRFVALRRYVHKEELAARQAAVDKRLSEQAEILQNKFTLTTACGICCIEDVTDTLQIQSLINRANFAQKTVKQHPDIHYGFYNEQIREKMIEEITIQSRMHAALANHEFLVYLQPKVEPASGTIRSAEALVRWNTPEHGLLAPGAFIPIFEKNHFISELDRYVFETVCRWIRKRLSLGKAVVPISVNVSRLQFYKADFVAVYTAIRDKYRIPAGMLEIEFTETVAFENQGCMVQVVTELHNNGFKCSLDDFGSGYSSLGALKDLPIDVLKLDASFFSESVHVERDNLILKGVISMIKTLRIQTVAEGIERFDQVEFLRDVGCDLIQGYYFYQPMPISDFEALLRDSAHEKSAVNSKQPEAVWNA